MTDTVSAAIEIAAPPERVWAVLADLASYPQWNPVFHQASGQLSAGSKITLTSTQPATGNPMTARVRIVTAEPAAELRWRTRMLGITISERSFILSHTGGGTRLVQAGTYRGVFARFPPKTIRRIQDAFETINQAIKQRAEDLPQAARG